MTQHHPFKFLQIFFNKNTPNSAVTFRYFKDIIRFAHYNKIDR